MKQTFKFYKTASNRWYIDLPSYTGSVDDLEMVQGADTMLDKVSSFTNECYLELSDEPFEGADIIKLIDDLSDSVGGGDYIMTTYKGEVINQNIWLCAVTLQVFGSLPSVIYVGYPNGKE
jgi:hypothetical protein